MSKFDVVIQRHANRTPGVGLFAHVSTTTGIRNDLHEYSGFVLEDIIDASVATYHVSADGVTYYALNNSSNAAIEHDITDDKAYTFPVETKPFPWIKIVLDDGTATAHLVRKANMSKQDVVIHRQSNTTPSVSLTNSAATSTAIRNDLHENAGFIITAHATAASYVIHVSADGTTFFALNNSSDAAVGHNLSASKAYAFPAECKPWPYLKIVLNAGTATVTICRKS